MALDVHLIIKTGIACAPNKAAQGCGLHEKMEEGDQKKERGKLWGV